MYIRYVNAGIQSEYEDTCIHATMESIKYIRFVKITLVISKTMVSWGWERGERHAGHALTKNLSPLANQLEKLLLAIGKWRPLTNGEDRFPIA